jgi:hypothetical protein
MDERVEGSVVRRDMPDSPPRLKLVKLLRMPAKSSSWAILRITADITARCSGCNEGIETSDLACEVTLEKHHEVPDFRFHHRCYRTWCATGTL